MAPLGARSLQRLAGVKPITLQRARALADVATAAGMDITIADFGGLRDAATQAQLVKWRDDSVAAGGAWYNVAPPGRSNHATGDAFDIDVLLYNGRRYRENETAPDAAYKLLADAAPALGLRAGYYFSGSRKDVFHFENVEVSASPAPTTRAGATSFVIVGAALLLVLFLLSLGD